MNITFLVRPNFERLSGGDKIQIEKTRAGLERRGHVVKIVTDLTNENDQPIDLVHVFNPSQVAIRHVRRARQLNLPVIMSTIHWDQREYFQSYFTVNRQYFKLRPKNWLVDYSHNQLFGLALNRYWYRRSMRHLTKMFRLADMLLPNSQAEAEMIQRDFRDVQTPIHVVHNGVDPIALPDPSTFENKYQLKDFVLSVGRIEYRKNQLGLLAALPNRSVPLVFIGAPFSRGYMELCRKLANKRGNVHFFDHMPQAEVLEAYAAAKVHALPSWYETPGLANLEAGLCGANLAVSDRGSTREYFGDQAEYCDPNNPDSIRTAVERALRNPRDHKLRERILRNFTWDQTVDGTLAGYATATEQPK